jgi:hypothetical protein
MLAGAALIAGVAAWIRFLDAGLVLSHYDAKAHLVVARRVIDSITPGWQQIGAVWLPLPHVIQILPVQIDAFYRTGAFASLVSTLSFVVTVWAAARLVLVLTGSSIGAATAAALLIVNPNLLYLQSTPMTEPLLLASVFLVVLWLYEWVSSVNPPSTFAHGSTVDHADGHYGIPRKLGWALFAAAWTRYEAWLIVGAAITMAAVSLLRQRVALRRVAAITARLAVWPAAAVMLFALNSRMTTGQWLVTGGFYEIDPTYDGLFLKSLIAVWWGTHRLIGYGVTSLGLVTAGLLLVRASARRADAASLIPVSLFAAAVLPLLAFVQGHPFRVRYMVVLAAACALTAGLAVALVRTRRAAIAVAAVVVTAALIESPPWRLDVPLIAEAQWDVPRTLERRSVTGCLAGSYRNEKILASMGSLAHYMQELSHDGFHIADFVHEGNGALWQLALETGPAAHAGWMLVEEQSEGGDVLAQRMREDVTFTRGMDRVCEGGGVALYRRR